VLWALPVLDAGTTLLNPEKFTAEGITCIGLEWMRGVAAPCMHVPALGLGSIFPDGKQFVEEEGIRGAGFSMGTVPNSGSSINVISRMLKFIVNVLVTLLWILCLQLTRM
jgi:hypothetical protein